MKMIVLTKKNLLTLFVCLLLGATALTAGFSGLSKAISTANTERKIPIYCVDKGDEKVVALSFDAAWGDEQTPVLLDILEKNGVKSTFFLVGQWVDNYPDSVKLIAQKGHDIGNHSNTHPHMTQLSESQMSQEIKECNEKIKAVTGRETTLFRAPYGDYNNAVVECVNSNGMYCVQWDVDSLDWKDPTPQEMVDRIRKKISNGSIILMHNGAKNTPEALPLIIQAIKEEGYTIVPVSEILLSGDYKTDHEGRMLSL